MTKSETVFDRWIRTNDEVGFKPNFLIWCPRCYREAQKNMKNPKEEDFEMFLRNSTL